MPSESPATKHPAILINITAEKQRTTEFLGSSGCKAISMLQATVKPQFPILVILHVSDGSSCIIGFT
jgi:hypothetical protein